MLAGGKHDRGQAHWRAQRGAEKLRAHAGTLRRSRGRWAVPYVSATPGPEDQRRRDETYRRRLEAELREERAAAAVARREREAARAHRAAERRRMLERADDPMFATVQRLLRRDEERRDALRAGDQDRARERLVEVSSDLDEMLDRVRLVIGAAGKGRPTLRDHFAVDAFAALPVDVICRALDMPTAEVRRVDEALRHDVTLDPDTVRDALSEIARLRRAVRQAAEDDDHDLIHRLVSFVAQLATLVMWPSAAGGVAAFAVGDPVLVEVARCAIAAVVGLLLIRSSTRDHHEIRRRRRYARARKEHSGLLVAIARLEKEVDLGGGEEHYQARLHDLDSELTLGMERAQLVTHVFTALIATIDVDWPQRAQYWRALGDILRKLPGGRIELSELELTLRAARPRRERTTWWR